MSDSEHDNSSGHLLGMPHHKRKRASDDVIAGSHQQEQDPYEHLHQSMNDFGEGAFRMAQCL